MTDTNDGYEEILDSPSAPDELEEQQQKKDQRPINFTIFALLRVLGYVVSFILLILLSGRYDIPGWVPTAALLGGAFLAESMPLVYKVGATVGEKVAEYNFKALVAGSTFASSHKNENQQPGQNNGYNVDGTRVEFPEPTRSSI
jgi:hypothetical protein